MSSGTSLRIKIKMKLLNQPIGELSFDDIVTFCKERHVEGAQIDYKKEFPEKGLAKHFAAFSNTRGGLIIVGVEEDAKGLPVKWEGIKNESKLIDRVHQNASNVDPIPDYETCVTPEKNGRAFLLIRIFEGEQTPYYVQNDSNIWVRTGNISKPIDIASPKTLEMLFGKREQAQLARAVFINRAYEVYAAGLKRAEVERKELIARKQEEFLIEQRRQGVENPSLGNFNPMVTKSELGSNVAMCTVLLQPYYPRKAFANPLELKESIQQFRATGRYYGDFPSLNTETIPEGILDFSWRQDNGLIECQQVYGHGLVFNSVDVLRVDENKVKEFWLSSLGRLLFISLLASRNLYKHFGYQGGVKGYLVLNDVENVLINRIIPTGWHGFPDHGKCLLNKYRLDIETDTVVLNDPRALQNLFLDLMNEIYIGFNMAPPRNDLMEAFLKEEGWLVEEVKSDGQE